MVKIGGSKTSSTREETLDPTAKGGLDFLINQARGLGNAPLVPGLSSQTVQGVREIGTGLGGIDPLALSTIQNAISTDFAPGGTEALNRVSDFVAEKAAGRVGDVFTAGGRTGSAANAKAIAEGVAGAISPFAFSFEQNELARQDAAKANQTAAAFGLQEIRTADDAAIFQGQLAQLQAAGLLDEQARRELEEPFRRLGLISGVITSAAGLEPKSLKGTGTQFGAELQLTAPSPQQLAGAG